MGKRVMRSNKRTQRRRGSKLKQRKKRSKLLKRTLKRRNSFKKKNTYKRRKTNMKRGGSLTGKRIIDSTPEEISTSIIPLSIPPGKLDKLSPEQKQAVEQRIKVLKDREIDQKMKGTWPEQIKAELKSGKARHLALAINSLIGEKKSIYVTRNKDERCKIRKVLEGKIYFHRDGNCKSFNKLRRGFDFVISDTAREITMNVNNLLSGYGFMYIFSGEIDGINDDGYLFWPR
jgi:hypothetical protein